MKQWDGVRESGGGGGGGSGHVFDEIVTRTKALRCGRFGCGMGSGESAGFRFKKSRVGGSGGWWYKGGENVVAVVKSGRKRGALKASGEE